MDQARSLVEVFSAFDALWEPRVVARVDDYDVKVAKVVGTFPEHAHAENDEYFHVLQGELMLELPEENRFVVLTAGDVYVVPRGRRHRPSASPGTQLLLFEKRGTENAGDAELTGTAGIALDG